MDTWATSSMTPQIAGHWLDDPALYPKVFPYALRPQAHEIIRTWAFDTMVKSLEHFGTLPWRDIAISGWGLAAGSDGQDQQEPRRRPDATERDPGDATRRTRRATGPQAPDLAKIR